ncbi:MAG TPA: DUF1428 domain-containing protein [Mesorhizobium sp.]|jgi:uncharacterized protein YbaA (DUF1428 family)|nr:DUF1428 domain-containing protein [Mesorhizobium sp.]
MSYVDGFLVPVPAASKESYRAMAEKAVPIFLEHGATRVVECWGDDVPKGQHTDFFMAVKAEGEENVVFSWVEWPSKEARDEGMKKFMADERLKSMGDMPFDGKRMIFGGFSQLVDRHA